MAKKLPPEEQERFDDLDQKIDAASRQAGILTEEEKKILDEKHKKLMHSSASAGFEFAGAIVVSTFAGIWLDKKLETAPLFMLLLIVLGTVVAFYNLYRTSENLNSSETNTDSQLHSDEKTVKKTPNKSESL